jgi:hypothetical protein
VKDCRSKRAYIVTEDTTSDIEDEEEKENDGEEEILGGEDAVTYRSAIVQRVPTHKCNNPTSLTEAQFGEFRVDRQAWVDHTATLTSIP